MSPRRKRQVRRITVPAKPRRRAGSGSMPSVCIACMKPIDLALVSLAITNEQRYTHSCGQLLYDPLAWVMEAML